jgi:hypothetical protein
MAIGSSIGSLLGGIAGTAVGGPLGTAIGSGLGAAAGQAIESIPALVKTDAEKENERRLKELRRMQEMGALGLTESEKQQLFTSAQGAAAGQMRQAQTGIRAAGAALGGTGAGTEALRQAQLAEGMSAIQAGISQSVESADLQRKRELEDEIQGRIAAKSEAENARLAAATGIAATGFTTGIDKFQQEMTIQGRKPTEAEIAALAKLYKVDVETATNLLSLQSRNPEAGAFAGKYLGLAGKTEGGA